MFPLQPCIELLLILLFLLSFLFSLLPFPPRGLSRQSLSFSMLFGKILFPNTIGPVAKVFLIVIDSKKIISCEINTAVLL